MEMGRSNTGLSSNSVDLTMNNSENNGKLYVEDEKVLAFHGGQWYDAKVRKAVYDIPIDAWTYWVHYLGWNRRYDEWLEAADLKKFTEEDAQKQLQKCGRSAMVKNPKDDRVRGKNGNSSESFFKQQRLITEENLLNVEIPPALKKQLLDDCENVTHLGKLVKLPRTPNVHHILKKYYEFQVKENNEFSEVIKEILSGLRCYFDQALPTMLLYKNERKQYEEARPEHIPPSTVYGAEHFLRLFVKLPEILHHAKIEEEALVNLQPKILDLLEFLETNQSTFFLSTGNPEELDSEIKE